MFNAELLIHATLVGSLLVFGAAAVLALSWAVKRGQFENFRRASEAIFDADEPIGRPTDRALANSPAGGGDVQDVGHGKSLDVPG